MNINTKSNFLEKKKLQKKKTGLQLEIQNKVLIIQKNLRAFILRRRLINKAIQLGLVQYVIMVSSDISVLKVNVLKDYINRIDQQSEQTKYNLLKKVILSCMKTEEIQFLQESLILVKKYYIQLELLFKDKKFVQIILQLIYGNKGMDLLSVSWEKLKNSPHIDIIPTTLLYETVLSAFSQNRMEVQGILTDSMKIQTALNIIDFIKDDKNLVNLKVCSKDFVIIELLVIKALKNCNREILIKNIGGLSKLIQLLRKGLQNQFNKTKQILMEENKNLLNLIEDEEQLQYFENKLRSETQFEDFCDRTLQKIQEIFQESQILHYLMFNSQKFRQILSIYITQINFIYDDRKIIFLFKFLSDEKSLKQMYKQKKIQFYSALNNKLITMDDDDFIKDNLFNQIQWKQIIQYGISKSFQITKKLLINNNKKQNINIKNRLFQKNNQNQSQLKILSDLLNNLNKKSIRTSKISQQYFINNQLDKYLNTFKFGIGARTIQIMLKNFPFTFRFQSRLNKLKQCIKLDKLNYNRSLFLQDEVDPDLIIEVRRGHQFIDAFDSCFNKDLRKKYKIIFFNEQGLEEEGVDGGGIIKQFINRVLKQFYGYFRSSFSDIYGMFYQTQFNQILPNCYSAMSKQYQFVGKMVGKAVYEGINIQQKFAQPFLNLLIGRQNTFEDLQYIDKQIYKSMNEIKKMSNEDLQLLQQTFTILDHAPFGEKRYVNLKQQVINTNTNIKNGEILVNSENKIEFVMCYADYKCNKQLEQKTRLFKKGFLTVMKSQWLTMFSNQQLNLIISGSSPNYSIIQLKNSVVYNDYNQKCQTIVDLWTVLSEFNTQQKSEFLFFVTSCSRPPTMGFSAMKPLICIQRSTQLQYLPTANTCMNVLRLPDYKNKQTLKHKLLYAINAKAGFQFA